MKIIADCNIPYVTQAFSAIGEVLTVPGREIKPEHVRDADILIVRSVTRVDETLLSNSAVRFVGTATIGVDHIDLDYLSRHNIGFASAPGSNAISAAEYVVSALLVLAHTHQWDLFSKTVAIVGVGNVGGNVYKRLEALGINCLLYDPPRQQQLADRHYVAWEEIVKADIISAHVPLTVSGDHPTHNMFDVAFFKQLITGATFINTARGDVVVEPHLKSILAERPDLHLVLDVWANEPRIDSELVARADIATPHIAGYSLDGKVRGTRMIYEALCKYLGIDELWQGEILSDGLEDALIRLSDAKLKQDALFSAVTQAYDVRRDDTSLRQIAVMSEQERAAHFDRLRKEYPVRREFSHYTVAMPGKDAVLESMLHGLDFGIKPAD